MNSNLFRKTSIDRVNSPEQLNEYIRVANPGVWVLLAAITVLLVGVVVWGVFGTIETTIDTGAEVSDGKAVCYVSDSDVSQLKAGMTVTIDNQTGTVKSVSDSPVQAKDFDDYILYLTGFSESDFCYAVEIEVSGISDGIYAASITVDSIHPISFVIH